MVSVRLLLGLRGAQFEVRFADVPLTWIPTLLDLHSFQTQASM